MKYFLSLIFTTSFIFTEQINVLLLEYQDIYNDDIETTLLNYQNENALTDASLNIIPSESFHDGNIATLNFESAIGAYDLDVIVFPHNLSAENWNAPQIFPPLTSFMENGGLVIFIGNNSYSFMNDNAWFSGLSAEQFQCCGMAITNEGCPNSELYNNVYTYPGCGNGNSGCASMFASPYWYQLSEEDMDENFFKIFEQDVELCNGWTYESSNLVVGKSFGLGNLILFGDSNPSGDGSNDYNATRNLLGNIIHYFSDNDTQEDVSDIDGNTYETVLIGDQVWMKENLKVTHYNNGDEIQYVYENGVNDLLWENMTIGAQTEYGGYSANYEIYGKLYNWYAVDDSRGICPEGWHVPSVEDLVELIDYLGGESVAGGKLKESGTEYWNAPNEGASNESGFSALGSGFRTVGDGSFLWLGESSFTWSSTDAPNSSNGSPSSKSMYLEYDSQAADISENSKGDGFSVRCIQSNEGCADEYACNYNEEANTDDGSCDYGCHDNGDYSLSFDGQDYINAGNNPVLNLDDENFEWEFRIKLDDINSNYLLLEKQNYYNTDGYNIAYSVDNIVSPSFWFSICSNSVCYQYYGNEYPVNENEWFDLKVTKDGSEVNLYVNGENITMGSGNLNGNNIMDYYVSSNADLYIGRDNNSPWPNDLLGNIEKIKITKSGNDILHYKFNQGQEGDFPDNLIDHSGNFNHGTISGATWIENITGCTDEYACNYNSEAVTDDGSCVYDCEDIEGFSYLGFLDQKNYYLSNTPKDWREAKVIALELGAEMVSIDSQEENDFISSDLTSANGNIWIGISDLANEGVWLNFSQEEVWIEDPDNQTNQGAGYSNVYTNWNLNEPNDIGGGDDTHCGTMFWDTGKWDDYDCGTSQNFIIELESGIEGCTDEYACNYNEEANIDDGSCGYDCYDNDDYSLSFDGQDDYLMLPFYIEPLETYTIEANVKFEGNVDSSPIAIFGGESGNFFIGKDGESSNVYIQDGNNTGVGAETNLFDGDMHHIAYSFLGTPGNGDGGVGKLYVDGELLIDQNFSGGTGNIYIGHENESDGRFFNGIIDGVRVSNINRYSNQSYENIDVLSNVIDEYTLGIYKSKTDQADVSQDYFIDFSGNRNHGTIYGAVWVENIAGCTDEYACNYDEEANTDDGSCDYEDLCGECGGNNSSCEIITDIDGNEYGSVTIGNQVWMKQNLKTANYNNGDAIPTDYNADDWDNLSEGAYSTYDDNDLNKDIYGNLYNWWAANDDRGVCPVGWELPSESDWSSLVSYLGGQDVAGGKLKQQGLNYWNAPNGGATNESGFSALPAGTRHSNGGLDYEYIGDMSNFWSTGTTSEANGLNYLLNNDSGYINITGNGKGWGGSIRCLKENIEGCMDPLAENYNEEAILDDNSCTGGPINHSSFTFAGEFDDGYYYISKNESYANDAIQECEDSNGNLVSISSQQENDFVSSLVPGVQFWIGLTDEDSEGNFEWVDGSDYNYQNWAPTEPSNSGPNGNEDHTVINAPEGWSDPFDGFWNDVDGNHEPYLFVLEYREVEGCTDQYACNYNEEANIDDDSCEYNNCDLIDGSFLFHGTSSVQINNFPTNYHNMTVSAKIKPNSISGSGSWDNIVDAYYQGGQTPFRLGFVDGELRFGYENGGAYWASTEYSDTEYNIVTGTREFIDGEYVLKLFINGELVDSSATSVSPDLTQLSQLVAIGDNATGHNDENFYGFIDNVSIWNIALSESEISESIPSLTGDEEGLIAYYNFNQSEDLISDVLIDRSGNMYHGTINGATWIENTEGCTDEYACIYDEEAIFDDGSCDYACHEPGDYSLSFDGEDDYVFIDKEVLSDSFTISAWIFPNFMDDSHRAVYADYSDFLEIWFGYGFEGKLRLHVGGLDYLDSGTNVIEYDSWNHIVAVWDGSEAKIYSNGNLVASGSNGLGNPEPHTFNLGARMDNNSNYHSGYLNKIDLFNHALSQEEIQYLNNPNHIDSSSSASYRFNQGLDGDYPNILIDHSGNRNHGTISGATWIENIQGCTDPLAGNFNEQATIEDGTCEYSEAEISINEIDFDILVYENLIMTESFSISNNGLSNLDWEILNSPDWLDILVTSGTIESGTSELISLEANSYGYECGDYSGLIEIITDDPNNLSITIPVSMNILYPVPVLSQSSLDFGDIGFESESTIDFIVENQGCSDLDFSGAFESQYFLIDSEETMTVAPGASIALPIIFTAGIDEIELLDNLILTYQNDPFNISDVVSVSASVIPDSHPIITSIVDVLEDQGGWVNLTFTRSIHDTDSLSRVESYSVEADYGNGWIISGSGNAYSNNRYTMQVHTQIDSSSTSDGLVDFRVIAGMEEGNFASSIAQGYSVDNIDPSTPEDVYSSSISGDNNVSIEWNYNPDFDFSYHQITGLNTVEHTIGNQVDIPLLASYDEYYVSSFDINGNSSAPSTYSSAYNLHYGANLVSFSVVPDDNSIGNLVECPGDVQSIIGQGQAATCLPFGWAGSLDNIEASEGYWLVTSESGEIITVDGNKNYNTDYDLNYGANLISYTCNLDGSLEDLISGEYSQSVLGIIGEGDAATILPNGQWVGSLDSFEPGKGYWIKVSEAMELNYDCPSESLDILSRYQEPEEIKNYVQSTKQAFYFFEDIENIEVGDRLESYCNNVLVGSRVWTGDYMDVPLMGQDDQDITANYCVEGSIPTFRLIKDYTGEVFGLVGDIPSWTNNQIFMLDNMITESLSPEAYSLSKAYPNPFNPSTTISFSVPSESFISIEVYDITGRNIQTLASDNYQPGYYSLSWDASEYSSGVYFVKMISENYIESQKIMLIK